jgi:hypothetical protein
MNEANLQATLKKLLDQQALELLGQLRQYADGQMTELRGEIQELRQTVDRTYSLVDGLAKGRETDEQERAVIAHEQDKHAGWIGQLAEATGTKLVPEQ